MSMNQDIFYCVEIAKVKNLQELVDQLNPLQDFKHPTWTINLILRKFLIIRITILPNRDPYISIYRTEILPEVSSGNLIIVNPDEIHNLSNLVKLELLL